MTPHPFSLTDKVALVTGGTGVLGSSMALALAGAGAKVAVLGRRHNAGEDVATAIRKAGGEAIAVSADVNVDDDLYDAKAEILKTWGRLDILVNGAGGNLPGAAIPEDKTFFDLDVREVRHVFGLNFLGTLLPTLIFGEVMAAQKSGVVVNISSLSAQRPLTRVVGYSASKAAVENFTKWLAVEMAMKFGEGIRVNAIAPGFFLTEQNRTLLTHPDDSLTDRAHAILAHTPMARFGQPDDLSGTLVWLCSEASRFVTGVVVPVDGGFMAYSGV